MRDAAVRRRPDGLARRLHPLAMTHGARQAARAGPPSVAVHDDGDVQRHRHLTRRNLADLGKSTRELGHAVAVGLLVMRADGPQDQNAFRGLINSTTVITRIRRSKKNDQLSM